MSFNAYTEEHWLTDKKDNAISALISVYELNVKY